MNTISLRLYPETEALYKRLLDECDAGTNGKTATADQFINYLLECAQNPRKIEVSKKADFDRIIELENITRELKNQCDVLKEAAETSKPEDLARITELEHDLFITMQKLTLLEEEKPGVTLPETSIVFELSEDEYSQVLGYSDFLRQKHSAELSLSQVLYVLIKGNKIRR